MRIFKYLFLKSQDLNKSVFYIFYSNNTFSQGTIENNSGNDGTNLEDLILDKHNIQNGQYRNHDLGLELNIESEDEWILWKKIDDNTYQVKNDTVSRFNDNHYINQFLLKNQKNIVLEPVQHNYNKLIRRKVDKNDADYFNVNWFLGNTCSYTCSYCPSYLNDGSIPWTDLEILKKFIDQLFNLVKNKKIAIEFTGGEVTLYKDYGALCAYIKSKGGMISMISNGSRTIEWWTKNAHNFDRVVMSYHTEFATKEHYLELVKLLRGKLDLIANIMTPPGKLDFCVELGHEVKELKDCVVQLMPIIEDLEGELLPEYTKHELDSIDLFNSKASEFSNYTKIKWLDFTGYGGKEFENGTVEYVSETFLVSNKENTWFGWNCFSGVTQIAIDATGDIHRGWCFVGGKIGNIANPNLKLPSAPVVCNKELCHCHFDTFSVKEKISVKVTAD